jgi:hypothetical protein
MKRFYFDLVGEIRAHDFMGHECSSKKEVGRKKSLAPAARMSWRTALAL